MSQISIVVVDDHPIFQQGLVDSLSLEDDIEVVGRAGDGPGALDLIKHVQPAIALLDVNLPGDEWTTSCAANRSRKITHACNSCHCV